MGIGMIQVEGFLLKHSSLPAQELFADLAAIIQVENGSPVAVRCTRKLFNNLSNNVDAVSVNV